MAGGGQGYADGGIIGQGFGNQQANPTPQFNTQSAYNNFASPNSNFMSYPQQGQPTNLVQRLRLCLTPSHLYKVLLVLIWVGCLQVTIWGMIIAVVMQV